MNTNINKTLAGAVISAGLLFGGAGVAAAQYGGDAPAPDAPAVESVDAPAVGTPAPLQVQDEAPADDTEANEGERRRGKRGCSGKHEAVAEAIGITVDELRAELDAGQSIADVAEANGVDVQTVIDAQVAAAEARLDEKVAEGRITAEEAAEKLESKTERIIDRVDDVRGDGSDGDEVAA